METITAYEALKNGPRRTCISGSDLCKFYSRPVDVKTKPGDFIEIEYESESDESVSPDKEVGEVTFVTVATQTDYRESETQTDPWDPPFVIKKIFKDPEVLHLKELSYGNGLPATHTEVEYIVQSRRNRHQDISTESTKDYETFVKKKQLICNQVQNKWNYKISKHTEKLLAKLKERETALTQELVNKSERQEKLLKNLWIQKKEQQVKHNLKLQKNLKKELKVLEKKYNCGSIQKFDAKAYGLDHTAKKLAHQISRNKDSLNRDIDNLISKYHMNPNGLSKLTDWLEKKRTYLYNEIPVAKPFQRTKREKITENTYLDLLVSKRTKMPPKIYREDYAKEESSASSVKSEIEFEVLELPEERVDLITIWQQVLQGRAYQKQMLELIDKHKDALNILLPSQIKNL